MEQERWRLEVRLKSRDALRQYMEYRDLPTAYALARRAGLGVGIVGHLVSGRRDTCSLFTAKKLEETLQCPPEFLFEHKMSQVSGDSQVRQEAS